MFKLKPAIFLFPIYVICFLILPAGRQVISVFAEESLTITTYYPSPYGSYNSLQTDKLGVGDNNNDGSLTSADIPTTAGNVWIKGNVGIGTTNPQAALDMGSGGIRLGGVTRTTWPSINLDTGILDAKTESSPQEISLINQGCKKLNNEDAKYGADHWMSCPRGFYVAAISDDDPSEQDVLCCPF